MVATPIFVILGVFGGLILAPESIDKTTLATLDSTSYGIVGGGDLMHLTKLDPVYPDFRAEYIYGGLSWDSFRPRFAVSSSVHGDLWTGAGIDYEKYWAISNDQAIFVGGNFLPGLYKAGPLALGSTIEFRSQFEVGLVQKGGWRFSVYVEHRSNAGIGRINPGIEEVGANLGFAL